jgi:histidinol dehydrogenase
MQVIKNPGKKDWKLLLQRPYMDNRSVLESVQQILNAVKQHGDEAIRSFSKKFDGVELETFEVSEDEIQQACDRLPSELKSAIQQAQLNIEKFHRSQLSKIEIVETMPGVQCWRKNVGIEKVGLYIPGGTAPLFSTVLMLAIPAKLAGCEEIILCTPCNREGQVHPAGGGGGGGGGWGGCIGWSRKIVRNFCSIAVLTPSLHLPLFSRNK